jgi:hypothetical protein
MLKNELAIQLRERQLKFGQAPKALIDACSDEQIIDSYITCSQCGDKEVTAPQLTAAIRQANNVDEFFNICESFAKAQALFKEVHRN